MFEKLTKAKLGFLFSAFIKQLIIFSLQSETSELNIIISVRFLWV